MMNKLKRRNILSRLTLRKLFSSQSAQDSNTFVISSKVPTKTFVKINPNTVERKQKVENE